MPRRLRTVFRQLLAISAWLSLLLFFGLIALWVRSYYVDDEVERWAGRALEETTPMPGGVGITIGLTAQTTTTTFRSFEGVIYVCWTADRHDASPAEAHELAAAGHLGRLSLKSTPIIPVTPGGGLFGSQPSTFLEEIGFKLPLRTWPTGERVGSFPIWVPAVLTLILPLIGTPALFRRLRRARRENGRCIRCGYDLRATPHRCPECGAGE